MDDLRLVPGQHGEPGEYRLDQRGGVDELSATLAWLKEEGWEVLSLAIIEDGPPDERSVTVLATLIPPPRTPPDLRVVDAPSDSG